MRGLFSNSADCAMVFASPTNKENTSALGCRTWPLMVAPSRLRPVHRLGKSPSEGLVYTFSGSGRVRNNATTASGRAENLMTPGWGS